MGKKDELVTIPIELIEREVKSYKIDIPEDIYEWYNFTRIYLKDGDKIIVKQ